MDTDVAWEADSLFRAIAIESVDLPGDHGIQPVNLKLDTSQQKRAMLRQGREFFHRHFTSCAWGILFTVFAEYPMQRWTAVLRRIDEYNNPHFIYERGMIQIDYLFYWFQDDMVHKFAEIGPSLYKVRKTHVAYAQILKSRAPVLLKKPLKCLPQFFDAIRRDLAHIPTPDHLSPIHTPTPVTFISQFDMVMALGIYFFILDVNPKLAGLVADEGYESYIYYIGQLGRFLGIEGRFNLALHPNPTVRKMVSRRLYQEVIAPCFKNFDQIDFDNACQYAETLFLGRLVGGVQGIIHYVVKNVLLEAESAAPATSSHLTVSTKITLQFNSLVFASLRLAPCRYIMNFCVKSIYRGLSIWGNQKWVGAIPSLEQEILQRV